MKSAVDIPIAPLITPNVETNVFGVFIFCSRVIAMIIETSANTVVPKNNGKSRRFPTAFIPDNGGISWNTYVKIRMMPKRRWKFIFN